MSGLPALVDFDNSVLDIDRLRATEGASVVERGRRLPRPLRRLVEGQNRIAPVAVSRMLQLLRADAASPDKRLRILVIGGGVIGSGLDSLYDDSTIDLIGFDIYASPVVQLIADGHSIPLADGSVDGVIIQAVLAYVREPWVVAAEIHRVLRSDGIVFAATPFMQQVSEGPYDFTRFTAYGLQSLFNRFERLESGAISGAGTALRWSLGYFARALTRSVAVGSLVQLCFFWLRYLDEILDSGQSLDGATGVYLLGRKAVATAIQDQRASTDRIT
ncbi:SAM-dependent methyltransferase [Mycobacterium sp. ENV421]|nr:SAM-dependent methyltransferase [Mycobacterium sp. ENV421]